MTSRDPEVADLVKEFREVVSKVYLLAGKLDDAVSELESFAQKKEELLERRSPHPAPYNGKERRRNA